jgi:lipopolysaccharide/colanic/teichoic acid biosynthesis glycosyltransferase
MPILLVISILILIDSPGTIFFCQVRVGYRNQDFALFKFRTMQMDSDKKGLLTIGMKDNRVTRTGYYLRKYKLDELPQLFNVLLGSMSVVGPRPEVRKFVSLYSEHQRKVLLVKPGITDFASIQFANENEILGKAENPESLYISEIMPAKLEMNLKYVENHNMITDLKIIWMTFLKIISN